jgi:hypothetical protein
MKMRHALILAMFALMMSSPASAKPPSNDLWSAADIAADVMPASAKPDVVQMRPRVECVINIGSISICYWMPSHAPAIIFWE